MTGDVTIVGRSAEIRALGSFVDSVDRGPAALALVGEAGIGKSTLWREGLNLADHSGCTVLHCRPVQSEAQLAFTALSDLLADVPHSAFDVLPGPQRRALEVALLFAEPDGELYPRAVGLGLTGLLTALAVERPLVLGIDDAHWIDLASQRVLAFALRRLRSERVGLLATIRTGTVRTVLDDLEQEGELAVARVGLGPLEPSDLEHVMGRHLIGALSRRALARVHATSVGNPLFALQIGQALVERGERPGDVDPPIPASLQEILGARLGELGSAISVVQAVAAISRPTRSLMAELFGPQAGADGVGAAIGAGVLVADGERLTFTHPLLATAAYAQLGPDQRRTLHSNIAGLLDDVEERARHLAIGVDQPNADVAETLELAAGRARARGAPDAAAGLWEAAAKITPADDPDAARARRMEAAQCWSEMDQVERARRMFEEILAEAPPGPLRSRLLARWAWTVADIDGFEASTRAFRDALRELDDDDPARIDVEQGLAWSLHSTTGVASAAPHARQSLELAERFGDRRSIVGAAALVSFLGSLNGHGLVIDPGAPILEASDDEEWPHILCRPDWLQGMLLGWGDNLDAAHRQFRRIYDDARERGNEHSLPAVLFHLARTQLLMGDWTGARRSAAACVEMTINTGQASERPYSCVIAAIVDAHLGATEAARAAIAEGLELASRFGSRPATMELLATRGFLALSLGEYDVADRTLSELGGLARETGMLEPALFRYHGDAIEAKLARGRLDEAETLLGAARQLAESLDRPWLDLVVARGHGLLEAAGGRLQPATEILAAAAGDDRLGQPFERARTLQALGSVLRRNRKKAAAREALAEAAEIFERLGARLWVARTDAELARIGGRAPAVGLTPTERRVAELIAAGRTYREAAAELFISSKTVQWNLSKVYRKLGISSRSELPGRLPPR